MCFEGTGRAALSVPLRSAHLRARFHSACMAHWVHFWASMWQAEKKPGSVRTENSEFCMAASMRVSQIQCQSTSSFTLATAGDHVPALRPTDHVTLFVLVLTTTELLLPAAAAVLPHTVRPPFMQDTRISRVLHHRGGRLAKLQRGI